MPLRWLLCCGVGYGVRFATVVCRRMLWSFAARAARWSCVMRPAGILSIDVASCALNSVSLHYPFRRVGGFVWRGRGCDRAAVRSASGRQISSICADVLSAADHNVVKIGISTTVSVPVAVPSCLTYLLR